MRFKHFLINNSETLFLSEFLQKDNAYFVFSPFSFPDRECWDILNGIEFKNKQLLQLIENAYEAESAIELKEKEIARIIFLNERKIEQGKIYARNVCKTLSAQFGINDTINDIVGDIYLRTNLAFENLAHRFLFDNSKIDLDTFTSTVLYYESHDMELDKTKTKLPIEYLKQIFLSLKITYEFDEFELIV